MATQPTKSYYVPTRYEETMSDYPNEIDFKTPVPETGLVVLAESRSGCKPTQGPAHNYRFALNSWQIELDRDNERIIVNNPEYGKQNIITDIQFLEYHVEYLTTLSEYNNMHMDTYTKGRFRLSAELAKLIIEIITNIQNGTRFDRVKYSAANLSTQISQEFIEPKNKTEFIIFDGWMYRREGVAYKFNKYFPEVVLKD
jgi:hypothetical protein